MVFVDLAVDAVAAAVVVVDLAVDAAAAAAVVMTEAAAIYFVFDDELAYYDLVQVVCFVAVSFAHTLPIVPAVLTDYSSNLQVVELHCSRTWASKEKSQKNRGNEAFVVAVVDAAAEYVAA